MKVLFDHCVSKYIPRGLNEIFAREHEVCALSDYFGRGDIKDIEWIDRLGKEGGWCIVSADTRITRNKIERSAFLRAGLIGFFFSPGLRRLPVHLQAARLLIIWQRLEAQVNLVGRGLFEIPLKGEKFSQLGS